MITKEIDHVLNMQKEVPNGLENIAKLIKDVKVL